MTRNTSEQKQQAFARKVLLLCAVIFIVSVGTLAYLLYKEWQFTGTRVVFFDVGQGDAIYIRTPDGQDILIDGGPDNSVVYKLGEYMPLSDQTIEYMILTHPHADHMTGLIEVLRRYEVKHVLYANTPYNTPEYTAWREEVAKEGAEIITPSQGDEWVFGGAVMKIVYPTEELIGKAVENVNNASVIAKYSYGDADILLMGDAEVEEETALLASDFDLLAEVLKAGHHGSKTSSSPEFLDAVHPEVAIVSSGTDNTYGHPHYRTLHEFASRGIRVFRTDESGDILFKSEGRGYEVVGDKKSGNSW